MLQLEPVGGVTQVSLRNAVISKNISFGAMLAFRAFATSFIAERKGIIPGAGIFSCVCCVGRETSESVCLDSDRYLNPQISLWLVRRGPVKVYCANEFLNIVLNWLALTLQAPSSVLCARSKSNPHSSWSVPGTSSEASRHLACSELVMVWDTY